MSSVRMARLSGLLAVVALGGGVLADVCTFYSPEVRTLEAAMPLVSLENLRPALRHKPAWHVEAGHYLSLFFIPLGLAGLYQVDRALRPAGRRLALLVVALGVLGFTTATAFHVSFGFAAALLQTAPGSSAVLARYAPLVLAAGSLSLLCMVLSFGVILGVTARGTSAYSRWFVLVNPLPIQVLLTGAAFMLPVELGSLLLITSLNVSLFVFFAASTVTFWDGIPGEPVDAARA